MEVTIVQYCECTKHYTDLKHCISHLVCLWQQFFNYDNKEDLLPQCFSHVSRCYSDRAKLLPPWKTRGISGILEVSAAKSQFLSTALKPHWREYKRWWYFWDPSDNVSLRHRHILHQSHLEDFKGALLPFKRQLSFSPPKPAFRSQSELREREGKRPEEVGWAGLFSRKLGLEV